MSEVFTNLIQEDKNVILKKINLRELLNDREERKSVDNEAADMSIIFEPNEYYKKMLETGLELVSSDQKDFHDLNNAILKIRGLPIVEL